MKKYLKKVFFAFDTTRCGPTLRETKSSEEIKAIIRLGQDLDRRRLDLSVVMFRLLEILMREKVALDPHIALTYFHLTDIPRDKPFYEHLTLIQGQGPGPQLWVDVDYHPMQLLDLPYDAEGVGELAIALITEGLKKLDTYEGFPHALVHEAISDFRKTEYKQLFKVVDKTIPGTNLKGRIDSAASAEKTVCTLSVSYRGTPLFQRVIWEKQGADIDAARLSNNFRFQDGKLLVFRDENIHVPDVSLDLTELPDAFGDHIQT